MNIKIGDSYFEVTESSVEYSTGVHATIYIKVNIHNHPQYLTHFTNLFELQKIGGIGKFRILAPKFEALGCFIKSIDTNFNENMNISFRADMLNSVDTSERREEIINQILDETSYKNKI